MNTFKFILNSAIAVAGVSLSVATMAAPIFHHSQGVGLMDACGSTEPAICVTFTADNSLKAPVKVGDNTDGVVFGKDIHDFEYDDIGAGNYMTVELDVSELKDFNATSYREYFFICGWQVRVTFV